MLARTILPKAPRFVQPRCLAIMASETGKRKSDGGLSPPPSKRIQSTTTQNAVASFFTPTSKKAPEKTNWTIIGTTLLAGHYSPSADAEAERRRNKRRKVAAFDLDSTLIQSISGNKFAKDAYDWKWWHPCIPATLKKLDSEGYQVAILSNQGGLDVSKTSKTPKQDQKKVSDFKTKVNAVLNQLDLPVSVYAATEQDLYRKPRTGMWRELLDYYDMDEVDLENCYFVGDAGGRIAVARLGADFSASDRNFAANVGIKYSTPEEFFLHDEPREFRRKLDPSSFLQEREVSYAKPSGPEIVVFVGSPGAGKSTFYWNHLEKLGYERVNQDILKTRDKCLRTAGDHLAQGRAVVVDATNADRDTRAHWVRLGKDKNVPVRCILFTANADLAQHNDTVRALNKEMNPETREMLPKMAFAGFASRFQMPTLDEGLADITHVEFSFQGTEAQRKVWSQYWT